MKKLLIFSLTANEGCCLNCFDDNSRMFLSLWNVNMLVHVFGNSLLTINESENMCWSHFFQYLFMLNMQKGEAPDDINI